LKKFIFTSSLSKTWIVKELAFWRSGIFVWNANIKYDCFAPVLSEIDLDESMVQT
jgi:hypothetical protein